MFHAFGGFLGFVLIFVIWAMASSQQARMQRDYDNERDKRLVDEIKKRTGRW